jgi:hypothetical protein
MEIVIRELCIGLEYIPKRAKLVQRYHVRKKGYKYMGLHMSVKKFVEGLNDLNLFLFDCLKEFLKS